MLKQLANFLPAFGAPGLPQGTNSVALILETRGEFFDVCGFTAAFGAFKGDENAGHN